MWTGWAKQHQAEVVVVPLDDDGIGVDADRIAAVIDDSTLVVSLSLVHFRTSALLDVTPIIEKARRHNALLVLDAYQAAGAVPVDVASRGIDVCIGGSVKFLCGGPGNGWMSVLPEVSDKLQPSAVGWISHARPFDFDFGEIDLAPGVGRFAGGTPNVPAAAAAEAGYQAIADIGISKIRERSISLTQPIVEAALAHGFTVNSPVDPAKRGGHVTVDPGGTVEEVAATTQELIRRGFVVDHRPGSGIRLAPHFYNRVDEGLAAVDELAVIMDK
jgi:kynureninase